MPVPAPVRQFRRARSERFLTGNSVGTHPSWPGSAGSGGFTMGSTQSVAAFRQFIDVGPNRGNLDALGELVDAECRYFMPGSNEPAEGAEGVKQVIAAF